MQILLQCRPGFESEATQEAQDRILQAKGNSTVTSEKDSGFVLLDAKAPRAFYETLHWKEWIFARQWWCVESTLNLQQTDRVNPILDFARNYAEKNQGIRFQDVCFEMPDTNDGRQSTTLANRLHPLIETGLGRLGLLDAEGDGPRLMIFMASPTEAYLGVATERSAPWPMGFPRLRFPSESPSRSTLKLAEAFEVFFSQREQELYLRPGMTAVDLGAAPGGWTWQLLTHGMRVQAIDNGPLKGGVLGHPAVTHLRADGFRFRPQKTVDWLVCDMVEQPRRVAELMLEWLRKDYARSAIFNLKLPMKKRLDEVRACVDLVRKGLEEDEIRPRILARQLYHDREEITLLVRKEGKAKTTGW